MDLSNSEVNTMTDMEQRNAAKTFAADWNGRGYEKGDTHSFWLSFLQDVLDVEHPTSYIEFEKEVVINGSTKFIDAYLPDTKVIIEQKSLERSLTKASKQSGGSMLTPFEQAKNYANYLPADEYPKWIITSNFGEFLIYNMNKPGEAPTRIALSELPKRYNEFSFLIDTKKDYLKHEMEVSIKAGELVGQIYDAFLALYPDQKDPRYLHSLNVLCVRLVFCLYAEDAGIFGRRDMFHDYLNSFKPENMRMGLIELFRILATEPDQRDPFANENLLEFPYVNGGLFSTEEDIIIPPITDHIRDLLLDKASLGFDWSDISPTIFGAVFESTLNPETRRSGGMHYTSIENIHKVIDPLFLSALKTEFAEIKKLKVAKTKDTKLRAFQNKLASLTFLDPAAGSGNFLTETYLSLRRLENQVLLELTKGQIMFGAAGISPIKVSIRQFYGIEINDFAVTVAKTALWIAESQMLKETEDIVRLNLDFLPLKTYVNMTEGNAVTMDWNSVVSSDRLNYIMGNPPFIGARMMNVSQKKDVSSVFQGSKGVGNLDYVSCWYKKAADYMKSTDIHAALVSTNSITQGEPVSILWNALLSMGVVIDFAHRTFIWDSEAHLKAHVHCVIIGFSCGRGTSPKRLYTDGILQEVDNINAYLVNAPNVLVASRKTPLSDVPPMVFGSMANDGGFLFLSREEHDDLVSRYPQLTGCIKRFVGSREFINNVERYCLWLKDVTPSLYRNVPEIEQHIAGVKEHRLSSNRKSTRDLALTPFLFGEIRQPESKYILVPRHSSEKRRYIPLGFMSPDVICGDANMLIPTDSLYHFGVLTSNVHMAWMRTVCGRIKSDYRYSASIVYNTFPWPDPSEQCIKKIEETAAAILAAREQYPDETLASLYDENYMPVELRTAHRANNRAVWEAYGKAWDITSETDCVAHLMKLYQTLVSE